MEAHTSVSVLMAIADPMVRADLAAALSEVGFAVSQAQNYEDAVVSLHASPRRLVVIVDSTFAPLLLFAASDRRMVHHHAYIALQEPGAPKGVGLYERFPYLKLWIVRTPTATELIRIIASAAQALGIDLPARRELVTR
jgi:hypothetical protein